MLNPELLNALSLIIGLQNLQENREQSEHNDVQKANDEQERHLLEHIHSLFEEQNVMLRRILYLLEDKDGNT